MFDFINPIDINERNSANIFSEINESEMEQLFDLRYGEGYRLFSRGSFCEFLDVRESTLSNWLKEKKMPQYAKVAFGLMIALKRLQKINKDFSDSLNTPVIIQLGNEWALVEINQSENPEGKILARGFNTRDDAQRVQDAMKAERLLTKSLPMIMTVFQGGNLAYEIYYQELDKNSTDYRESNDCLDDVVYATPPNLLFLNAAIKLLQTKEGVEEFIEDFKSEQIDCYEDSVGALIVQALKNNLSSDEQQVILKRFQDITT